jgi:hypothetical protein
VKTDRGAIPAKKCESVHASAALRTAAVGSQPNGAMPHSHRHFAINKTTTTTTLSTVKATPTLNMTKMLLNVLFLCVLLSHAEGMHKRKYHDLVDHDSNLPAVMNDFSRDVDSNLPAVMNDFSRDVFRIIASNLPIDSLRNALISSRSLYRKLVPDKVVMTINFGCLSTAAIVANAKSTLQRLLLRREGTEWRTSRV